MASIIRICKCKTLPKVHVVVQELYFVTVTIMKRLSALIFLATVLVSVCQQTQAASCPYPYPNLANGRTCSYRLSGGIANYTLCCDTGYTMVGNTTAICDNGVFTFTAGNCTNVTPSPSPSPKPSAGVTAALLSQVVIALCFAALLIARC